MISFLCFFGFHKKRQIGINTILRRPVWECVRCGKIIERTS